MPDANKYKSPVMAREFGDACKSIASYVFAAAAANTKVNFCNLPVGTEIEKIDLVSDGLGASTTMQIGLEYPDGDGVDDADYFLAAASSATAGRRTSVNHPELFDKNVRITGTLAGAVGTGKVTCVVSYRFKGTP